MSQTLEDMAAAAGKDTTKPKAAPSTAADRIADDQRRREALRQERRKEIKAGLQKRDELMGHLEDIELQLRLLDTKSDSTASEHAAKAQPLQAKLANATGEQRSRLLSQLQDLNVELEQTLQAIENVRQPLKKEWSNTRGDVAGIPTQQRLSADDLASGPLRVERFVLERRHAAALARSEAAASMLSQLEPLLRAARSTPVSPDQRWLDEDGQAS